MLKMQSNIVSFVKIELSLSNRIKSETHRYAYGRHDFLSDEWR